MSSTDTQTPELGSESIFSKVVISGLWVLSGNTLNRILGFIKTIILARLLSPADFGLFGIAMLVLGSLDQFTKAGVEEALIQKKKVIEQYLNVAWTINIVRGLVVFVLIYLLAPYAAQFFRNEQADPIIKTISIILILHAFYNIGIVHLQKDLSFKKLFFYRFSGNLADFIVAVSVALVLKNVWALICGLLVGHYTRLVVSYLIHPYRPTLRLDCTVAKEIFRFGGWITGIGILAFLVTQGDDAVVGRVLGPTSLGFYYLAFLIASLPVSEIRLLVSRVMLPAYAKMSDDMKRLKESYLRVLQMTVFVVTPAGIGLCLVAPEFTLIILGQKWEPIIAPLQLLAIAGILTSFVSTGTSLFYASGRPKIEFQIQSMRLIVLAFVIYPLTVKWGITGTALAVTISSAIVMPFWLVRSMYIIEASLTDFLRKLLPIFIASGVMCIGVFSLKQSFYDIRIAKFSVLVLFGIFIYFSTLFVIWKFLKIGPLKEFKTMFNAKSAKS
jgi:PST family polysaccharide transporter